MFSDFYLGIQTMAPTLTYVIADVDPDTQYTIKISGIESYGKQSVPLTAVATTASQGSVISVSLPLHLLQSQAAAQAVAQASNQAVQVQKRAQLLIPQV